MEPNKISKTVSLLDAIRKFITHILWTLIIIVILSALGRYIFFKEFFDFSQNNEKKKLIEKSMDTPIDWHDVDKSIADAVVNARESTFKLADEKLSAWTNQLMERVDGDFLDWYFSYWTQQILGLESLWHKGIRLFIHSYPSSAERITEEIQMEFSKRVLKPVISELEMERILREILNFYLLEIRENLIQVSLSYHIPSTQWSKYLEGISIIISDTDASRQTPVSLKAIYVSGAGSAALFAAKFKFLLGKMGGKIAAKTAGKTASKMAAKTGSKIAAKTGGKFLGTIIGFGILVWDVWDHELTKRDNRPILRQSILDFLKELKDILLNDPEEGIFSVFHEIEQQIVHSISKNSPH